MPALDLDTAARHGTGPARFIACMLLIAVRERADRLTIGPDPTSGVIGAEVTCVVSGQRYQLVPPPIALLPRLIDLLRQLTNGEDNWLSLRVGGHGFAGRVNIEATTPGDRVTIDLPASPDLSANAEVALEPLSDENGLIEFEDAEFQ